MEVPLLITPRLQSQIRYLCEKVSSIEWSGVLFYREEGTFGQEDYKVIGEYAFLMDIGSEAYTEYNINPDVTRFIMDNKNEFFKMKMGHIHSHHNMGVFFSGTDTSEIVENSQRQSRYLSLIVNNKNQMTAKIAFRAIQKSVSSFNFVNTSDVEFPIKPIERENEVVLVYNCKISKPAMETPFTERYRKIAEEKNRSSQSKNFAKTYSDWSRYSSNKKEEEEKEEKTEKMSQGKLDLPSVFTPSEVSRFCIAITKYNHHQSTWGYGLIESLKRIEKVIQADETITYYEENEYLSNLEKITQDVYKVLYPEDTALTSFGDMIEQAADHFKSLDPNNVYDVHTISSEYARLLNLVIV